MKRLSVLFILLVSSGAWAQHARILLHDRSVKVEESGLSHITDTYKVKILDWKGASAFEVLRLDYDPATNVVKFLSINVKHKDGTTTGVDLSTVRDLPQPQRWIYWGTRMKLVSVPGLRPGDVLEYQTYKKGFTIAYLNSDNDERYIPPMRGHYYEVVAFAHKYPCDLMRYSLFLPRDKQLQYAVYHGSLKNSRRLVPGGIQYVWTARKLPALPHEPDQVETNDMALKLVLTTVPDWQTKSRWFYNVNKNQFRASDAIRKKVAQVIKGARTDKEKASRLLHWVAENIRYAGITMGKGEGYTLHPGTMTFHDRCGVCKDIAGMLITMLKVAGLDVYPAMTMAGEKVEDVPADQFNHCVVAWRQKDGRFMMLDPTWAPASRLLWCNAEFNQDFLIGTPKGETLMQTPYVPPEANTLSIKGKSTVDAQGNLKSTVVLQGTGYADTRLRRNFVYRPMDRWKAEFEALMRGISPAGVLLKWQIKYLRDLSRPVQLSFTYKVPHWALKDGPTMTMRVPLASPLFANSHRFSPFLSATKEKKRKTAAWFWSTWRYQVDERITLPPGVHLAKPIQQSLSGGGARGHVRLIQKGRILRWSASFAFGKRRVTTTDYPKFKAVTDLMRRGRKLWVLFGGAR